MMRTKNNKREIPPAVKRYLRHFGPILRKQRLLIAGSVFSLCVEGIFRILEPWPLKIVFDHLFGRDPFGAGSRLEAIDAAGPLTLLTAAAVAVVLIRYLRALGDYFMSVGFALIGNRLVAEIRAKVHRHIQSLSIAYHTQAKAGDLTLRLVADTGKIQDAIVTALLPLLANLFVVIGMMAVMFGFNWRLALIALAVLPIFGAPTLRITRKIHRAAKEQRRSEGRMAGAGAESIGAMKVVQALSLDRTFAAAFSGQNKKNSKDEVKTRKLSSGLELRVEIMVALSTALVLWFGARQVIDHALTPGELLVFLSYLKTAYKPIRSFSKYLSRIAKASAACDRVLDLLEEKAEIFDLPGAIAAPRLNGAVRFEGVDFAYEPGRPALKNVDIALSGGEHLALVGPSGSGKSTLVGLLLRLYDPSQGRVTINGRDLRDYTLDSLRAQVSILLQDCTLFAASVWDNIAYGAPGASFEAIAAAARLAEADGFIAALPKGYDTLLGERGFTLSNGQRQRIAVARAAVRNAPILILDEPTTGLDRENEAAVIAALKNLARDRTTFLITHNPHHAARCDRIAFLDDGALLEMGSHEELIRKNGRYAALFETEGRMTKAQETSHAV